MPANALKRRHELATPLVEHLPHLFPAQIDRAETQRDDRRDRRGCLQHVLVSACVSLEPIAVVETLRQNSLVIFVERHLAHDGSQPSLTDQLDPLEPRERLVILADAVDVPGSARGSVDHESSSSSRVVGSPAFSSSARSRESMLVPFPSRPPLDRKGSPSHQSIPNSRALSADATRRRRRTVSSSMSSRLIWMSPAITIPLSRIRSSTSASCAGALPPPVRCARSRVLMSRLRPRPATGCTGGRERSRGSGRPRRVPPRSSRERRWTPESAVARRPRASPSSRSACARYRRRTPPQRRAPSGEARERAWRAPRSRRPRRRAAARASRGVAPPAARGPASAPRPPGAARLRSAARRRSDADAARGPRRGEQPSCHESSSLSFPAREFQPLEQLILDLLVLGFGQLAGLEGDLGLDEEALERRLAVDFPFGHLRQALGEPDRSAKRSERQQEKTGQEAHCSDTKWCGGSGPVSLKRITPLCRRARSSAFASNSSTADLPTRNAARTTSNSATRSSTATSRARDDSDATISSPSRARRSASAWETASPSAT